MHGRSLPRTGADILTSLTAFPYHTNVIKPKWRNWQTRQVQDLVPVKGVEVRVLSSALRNEKDLGQTPRVLFSFPRTVNETKVNEHRYATCAGVAAAPSMG